MFDSGPESWFSKKPRWMIAPLLVACFLATKPQNSQAQQPDPRPVTAETPKESSGTEPQKTEPVKSPGDDKEGKNPGWIREQTIYVPFHKLRELFEAPGRGVYIPYERFQELWTKARASLEPVKPPAPPVNSVIASMESDARVEGDVVLVKSTLSLDLLGKEWHEALLRLGDVAIRSAKLDGAPARIVSRPNEGYVLLVEPRTDGKESGLRTLEIEFAKAHEKTGGVQRVSFQTPSAVVHKWTIRVPGKANRVQAKPSVASRDLAVEGAEETKIEAFLGPTLQVDLEWNAKAEGASGLEALVSVESRQEVSIEENAHLTKANIQYQISRAPVTQLQLRVSSDHKVVNVADANVKQWDVQPDGGGQLLKVDLFEPATKSQSLLVELERFFDKTPTEPVDLAQITVVNASRQQGMILLRAPESIRADVARRVGLSRVDASQLGLDPSGRPWTLALRHSTSAWSAALSVKAVEPRVVADTLTEVYLEPEMESVDWLGMLEVSRAGVFQLEAKLPTGFTVRDVVGRPAPGFEAAQVESHRVEGSDPTKLTIQLGRQSIGRLAVMARLERRLEGDAALSNPGAQSTTTFETPRFVGPMFEHGKSFVVFHAPSSLRVNPKAPSGMRPIAIETIPLLNASTRDGRFPNLQAIFGYAVYQPVASLTIDGERRQPQATVRQALMIEVDSGVAKHKAIFEYEVRYGGLKTLRLDLPTSVAQKTRGQINGDPIEPAPADVENGYIAYQLRADGEFTGNFAIELNWEEKLKELKPGESQPLEVPRLIPRGVDRAWGQLAIAKAPSMDVTPADDGDGLRPIDPDQELITKYDKSVSRAYEFLDKWALKLNLSRFELGDVKRLSIERAYIRAVVTRSKQLTYQCFFRVRSLSQRLPIKLPDGVDLSTAFDTQPLFVDGKPVTLEREGSQLFVPLTGQTSQTPAIVELRYTMDGDASHLELPQFEDGIALQKVYLTAYLPREQRVLHANGPWEDLAVSRLGWNDLSRNDADFSYERTSDANLADWVREGLSIPTRMDSFAVDGVAYRFATVHPAQGPESALGLWSTNRAVFASIIWIGFLAAALVLVTRRFRERLFFLAIVFVGASAVSMFWPRLAIAFLESWWWLLVWSILAIWIAAWLLELWNKPPRLPIGSPFARRRGSASDSHPDFKESTQESSEGESAVKAGEASEGGDTHA